MEERLSCQIRRLQVCVLALLLATVLLGINCVHPLLPRQRFKVLEAERINIREKSGILKARFRTQPASMNSSVLSEEELLFPA